MIRSATQFILSTACLLGMAAPAVAALYRCGNVFQDRPCDAGTAAVAAERSSAKAATPKAAAAPTPAGPSPFATTCKRMGESAQRIAWAREGGATREKQLADSQTSADRAEHAKIIGAVYERRGSAPEIRASIEAECVVEKQKAADAMAVLNALQEAANAGKAKTAASPGAQAPETTVAPAPTSADPLRAKQCTGYRAQLASNQIAARSGGDAAAMERLNAERRRVQQSLSDAKC